jgi:ABC-type dipeptide/oligopeptide/nickel transport system ATPase subunit
MKILLVCGPYGSGTTAVAGLLANLGALGLGPYQRTNDPRTPNAYELLAFRELVLSLVSEETMSLKPDISIEAALSEFKDALVKRVPQGEQRPIFLKHPASALIIPHICRVFDTRLIYLLRPIKDIEATRRRRSWFRGAPRETRIIYMHMFDHFVNERSPTTMVRYTDLIEAPVEHARALAAFCGLDCDECTLQQAAGFILPQPAASAV